MSHNMFTEQGRWIMPLIIMLASIDRGRVKRPDGVTFVPWQSGRAVAWDVTVTTTLADSYTSQLLLWMQQLQLRLQLPGRKSNTLISQPHRPTHFSQVLSRHWDRSMSQLLTVLCELGRRISSKFQNNYSLNAHNNGARDFSVKHWIYPN